ncbi:MAG: 2-oxoacid:acceptor oxidoreductase subunit alpha, partial [Gammaproteobacteria bacterium]|nr:2-oxoacid:acceptor oxidoreductase subunit alpha [Gammaproteobacteria bacterium]
LPKSRFREDINVIGMPLMEICNATYSDPRQRQLFKNIIYIGALTALLNMDVKVVEALIGEQYKGKDKLIAPNVKALHIGRDYATLNLNPISLRLKASNKVGDRIFIEGNSAAALGAVYGGATVCAWYPITPSSSLADAFTKHCSKLRVDPETKEAKYAIIQAEDELASIGMVIGASWNGARAFTATSGPGISLMQEFIGLSYFAEIPAVIFDVQRAGPSTGMPTRTQQCDLLKAAYASHGDTRHVCLYPADPEECFYLSVQAFDLAERLQTPVLVLSDIDIGMNDWMCPELKWDDAWRPDRGKMLERGAIEKLERFHRYVDRDGDGIGYRTLPGVHPKGAYFTRGSGHTQYGAYTEDPHDYQQLLDQLLKKWDTAKRLVPAALLTGDGQSEVGIISVGSCDGAIREALAVLTSHGIRLDYLRVRAFPFGAEVEAFVAAHRTIFVIEQNRDAQLRGLLTLETAVEKSRLRSLLHYNGLPISSSFIVDGVLAELRPQARGEQPGLPAPAARSAS